MKRASLGLATVAVAALMAQTPAMAAQVDCGSAHLVLTNLVGPTQSTSSTEFVAIPDTSISTTASPSNCVIVHYNAAVTAPMPGGIRVRMLVNGSSTGISPPFLEFHTGGAGDQRSGVFLASIAGPAEEYTFTFEFMSMTGTAVSVRRQSIVLVGDGVF